MGRRRLRAVALLAATAVSASTACASHKTVGALVVHPAQRFRVVYRVTNSTGSSPSVRWEVLTVNRPFRAAYLTYATDPRKSNIAHPLVATSGTVSDVDQLYTFTNGALQHVSGRQPGLASGDQALGVAAPEAVQRGLARYGSSRVVLGRTCRDLRLFEPPAGPLVRVGNSERDRDDMCIDDAGIVLREDWAYRGTVVQSRIAVEVAVGAAVPVATVQAELSTANALEVPAGLVMPTAKHSDQPAPQAPEGFALNASVDFVLPRTEIPGAVAYGSTVWAFARGADAVTFESGAGAVHPWGTKEVTRPARIAGRDFESAVRSDGVELRYLAPDGAWVRLRTTRPLAFLVAFARGLPPSSWSSLSADVPK